MSEKTYDVTITVTQKEADEVRKMYAGEDMDRVSRFPEVNAKLRLFKAIMVAAPRPLAVGDVVYTDSRYNQVVHEITDSGYVITKDSDDGELNVYTVAKATERRDNCA